MASRSKKQKMRQAGLRQVRMWVIDTRVPGFAEEARRQSLLLSSAPEEKEVLEFIEAAFDSSDWD